MPAPELGPEQQRAVLELSSGKILYGGVGSGKSRAAIAYYDSIDSCGDLYVLTTAKKRDSLDWQLEAAKFGIGPTRDSTVSGTITVDSWNNIAKYEDVVGSTFIFDEQRLVGKGAWVKSFHKIAKNNAWIVLSATPGDTWMDFIPVFVANGFYSSATDFSRNHIVWSPYARFPRVDRFLDEPKLERLRDEILVEMPYEKHTHRKVTYVDVDYDKELYDVVAKDRWNPFGDCPIRDAADWFAQMRRVVYSHPSRLKAVRELLATHERLVVFYNFNYELDALRALNDTWSDLYQVAEWNGHKHEEVPETEQWIYLVQYMAGAEGWNCTSTDAMVFYSLTYSYKRFEQSQGRIDRRDTLYTFLLYYGLITDTIPDRAVLESLKSKKTFNERAWVRKNFGEKDSLLIPTTENEDVLEK